MTHSNEAERADEDNYAGFKLKKTIFDKIGQRFNAHPLPLNSYYSIHD